MSEFHGKFVWYELVTGNSTAAEEFYKEVVGWGTRDAGHTDMPYTVLTAGDAGVGGIWQIPDEDRAMGIQPGWVGYIQVDDIDASATQLVEAGGKIYFGPEEIPGVGRFAVVSDPQGAKFDLFQQPKPVPSPDQHAAGHVGWHELYATDYTTDFEFYATLFGWTKTDALEMGEMGTYQMFATGAHTVGGMMNRPQFVPVSHWLFYFNVDSADAAVARLESAGGQVLHGPAQVPGGLWIVQAKDPEGVIFAVVAPVR